MLFQPWKSLLWCRFCCFSEAVREPKHVYFVIPSCTNSLKTLYCVASLASSDFPLMPCNIKQSCHSSGQLWTLQYMDENQCWSWPVPNQKAVTTRTGTTSNLQDLFGFGSTRQILARYHSRGIKTRNEQRTFIKINEKEIKTDIFYVTQVLFYTRSTKVWSLPRLLSTYFLNICLKFLFTVSLSL